MILLTSTTDVLQLYTSTATNVQVHASYVDVSGSTVTPGHTNTTISGSGTTTIVASPGASTQRNVKFISVANAGSALQTLQVIVQHVDSTPTTIDLNSVSLAPGFCLFYSDLAGWGQMDTNGALLESPVTGRLLNTTNVTATTSSTFTTGASTNYIRLRGVGGGAGGGGCAAVASGLGSAGGGGAGGYLEVYVAVSPNTGYTYQCGAAGNGASGAAGGNGSNSTFTVSSTYTAYGGTGGPLCTPVVSGSLPLTVAGGAGGIASTNGSVNGAGQPGQAGVYFQTTGVESPGSGGSGPCGGGGWFAGNATGYGAGGSGNYVGGSGSANAGANGTQGIWIIEEYA